MKVPPIFLGELFILYQKGVRKMIKRNRAIKRLTVMAMLSAVAIILVYFIRLPIFPSYDFLEYDPADIPIFIGTMLFGPWYGLIMTAAVSVIQGLTVSARSGVVGIVMHYFATGSFVVAAGLIYNRKKTFKRSVVAMGTGAATMTVFMVLWNMILTPVFMGVSRDMVMGLMLPVFIPFNLIKAFLNAVLALVLYTILNKAIKFDEYLN